MRLGLAIHGSLDTLTGGYLYDRLLVEYLRYRGHTVKVIELPPAPYPLLLLANLSPAFFHRLKCSDIDLLIEDALGHPALIQANRRLRKTGLPLVALVHQVLCRQPRDAARNRWFTPVERCYFHSVDALLCNGSYTLEAVRQLAGHSQPALAAPPGGDRLGRIATAEAVAERALRPGPLELVLLANVTPNKGVCETLEALRRVTDDGWRLTVVGSLAMDDGYARQAQALAAAGYLRGRIVFTGSLEGAKLKGRLLAAHVLVLPFSVESFGICLLEAMAFGLPPIVSAIGGGSRFVSHAWNGFQVLPGDGAGFASYVGRLQADRKLLAAMGARALETFARQPTWRDSFTAAEGFLVSLQRTGSADGARCQQSP